MAEQKSENPGAGSVAEIFAVFLRLGLTSFGGPIAHLGYFRTEFVERRHWMSDAAYADLVALCQFLPGPASSQAGFAVGWIRGGWAGGLAAWAGFTLPSAFAMVAFAYGASVVAGGFAAGVIAGLKILAVAVVAHAVLGMGRSLAPDGWRLALALGAMALIALWPSPVAQVAAIAASGLLGFALGLGSEDETQTKDTFSGRLPERRTGAMLIAVALGLLALLPLLAASGIGGQALALFEAFYRSGALVFGGGHVVLPLLETAFVGSGWVDEGTFLAGYGAAQAVPGPLFTFAAFLGAAAEPTPNGPIGAAIGLAGIFLPGLLLVIGVLPYWTTLRGWAPARALLAGVNAAVVGVLGAALYDPVFVAGVRDPLDFALAAAAFFALTIWRVPVWSVVAATALAGGVMGAAGL